MNFVKKIKIKAQYITTFVGFHVQVCGKAKVWYVEPQDHQRLQMISMFLKVNRHEQGAFKISFKKRINSFTPFCKVVLVLCKIA